MRLLLAEDERSLSRALVKILEHGNYSVDAVCDGEAALDYLENGNYDGDERAIRQLISILLDNALKYSDEGGSIRIALARRGKNISLSVYNTTREIQSDDLSHLFDRFYRTDRSRNSETGGYGLGLSIAQAVVSAHRGKISAKSSDGHSLTVTALLPC